MSVLMRMSRERIKKILDGEIKSIVMKYGPELKRARTFYLFEAETNKVALVAKIGQAATMYMPYGWERIETERLLKNSGYSQEEIWMMASKRAGKGGSVKMYEIKGLSFPLGIGIEAFGLKRAPIMWQYVEEVE